MNVNYKSYILKFKILTFLIVKNPDVIHENGYYF